MPTKNISETAIVPPIALPETRSSSGTCWFADHESAFMPSDIDSARFTTPRTSGLELYRSAQSGASWTSTSMSPSGVRTATAHVDSPRIMTPSTTAWPPMYRGCLAILDAPPRARARGPGLLPALLLGLGLFAYRRWKRSTRPPVSTSFCLPV